MNLELHVHTNRSIDAEVTFEELEKYLKASKIDFLAVCDHDLMATDLLNHPKIISGIEQKSEKGEIIGLFLSKPIQSHVSKEIIREIKNQGGLVMIPHPFVNPKAKWDSLKKQIDLFEVFNPRISHQANKLALEYALKNKLIQASGTDAHALEGLGLTYLKFPVNARDKNQLKSLLKKNNFTIARAEYSPTSLIYRSKTLKSRRQRLYKDYVYYRFRLWMANLFFLPHRYQFGNFGADKLQGELDDLYQYGSMWFWRLHHRLRINAIFKLIDKPKGMKKALDVGCNRGFYSQTLSNLGYRTSAIDISLADLFMAKKIDDEKKINYLIASAENLPFGKNQFDLVVCSEVLEHLDEPVKGVIEIKRVLKNKGEAIITMPNAFSYLWLRYNLVYWAGKLVGRDFRELKLHTQWPVWRIKRMLEGSNFKISKRAGVYTLLGEPIILNILIKYWPTFVYLIYKLDVFLSRFRIFNYFSAFQIFVIGKKND